MNLGPESSGALARLSSSGTTWTGCSATLYVGAGDPKPGPCVYTANNSPTEPSPPAPYEVYYVITERYKPSYHRESEGKGEEERKGKGGERKRKEEKEC